MDLDQLQDALVGVFIRLDCKDIVLVSFGDFEDGAPVVGVLEVQVQSFDS